MKVNFEKIEKVQRGNIVVFIGVLQFLKHRKTEAK